jgi:hypothetical protein
LLKSDESHSEKKSEKLELKEEDERRRPSKSHSNLCLRKGAERSEHQGCKNKLKSLNGFSWKFEKSTEPSGGGEGGRKSSHQI